MSRFASEIKKLEGPITWLVVGLSCTLLGACDSASSVRTLVDSSSPDRDASGDASQDGSVSSTEDDGGTPQHVPCEHDGGLVETGKIIQEDCNTCICGSDGKLDCTSTDCALVNACVFQGRTYPRGTTAYDAVHCALCLCADEALVCDSVYCPESEYCSIGGFDFADRRTVIAPDGCNTLQCLDKTFAAVTANQCGAIPALQACGPGATDGIEAAYVLYLMDDTLAISAFYRGCPSPDGQAACYRVDREGEVRILISPKSRAAACEPELRMPQFVVSLAEMRASIVSDSGHGSLLLKLRSDQITYSY